MKNFKTASKNLKVSRLKEQKRSENHIKKLEYCIFTILNLSNKCNILRKFKIALFFSTPKYIWWIAQKWEKSWKIRIFNVGFQTKLLPFNYSITNSVLQSCLLGIILTTTCTAIFTATTIESLLPLSVMSFIIKFIALN